jgi:carboxyl-terminal processing protease
MLRKMRKTAEEEGYFDESKSEYEALFKKVTPSKERDLEKFKSEIKAILENEIIARYYFQKGRAIHSFEGDEFVDKAKQILGNSKEYNTILRK